MRKRSENEIINLRLFCESLDRLVILDNQFRLVLAEGKWVLPLLVCAANQLDHLMSLELVEFYCHEYHH
jgi:hypothetical protein